MWLIYISMGLIMCVLAVGAFIFLRTRAQLKNRAERFGVCVKCIIPYDSRCTLEYIRKHAGGNMYQQKDVWVTEVYCPQCGAVKKSDRAEAMKRAERETIW
jgi:hypothetical protein